MSLKYTDYVKEDQQIDQELTEVRTTRDIPDSVIRRFDGKSIEDVLESYAHLERSFSQKGEEVGQLRKTVDNLITLQSRPSASEPDTSKTVEPIKVDDLYNDPEGAISKVVDRHSTKRIKELEDQLVNIQKREVVASLTAKYPTWQEDAAKPEFKEWVSQSSARSRLAQAADSFDYDAARDLLEMWQYHNGYKQEVETQLKRERQFRDATLESSSPSSVEVPNSYSRSHVQEMRIKAKRGDQTAQRWLSAHAENIAIAYEEGTLTL